MNEEKTEEFESKLYGMCRDFLDSLGIEDPEDYQLALEALDKLLVFVAGVAEKQAEEPNSITIGHIKNLVCKYYRLTKSELVSRSRRVAIARPRQVAMFLARRHTSLSLQAIGQRFNRQHSTVLCAVGIVEQQIREYGPAQKEIDFLSGKLTAGNTKSEN